jgi:hypothetical protein
MSPKIEDIEQEASEMDQARREFLDKCDFVVSVPITWYLKGSSITSEAISLPLPLDIQVGIVKKKKFI